MIGIDIVKIERIAQHIDRLVTTICSKEEMLIFNELGEKRKIEWLAGRFAAKEAIVKAMSPHKIEMQNITIMNDDNGKPNCIIDGYSVEISIAHEVDYAIAIAQISKKL